MSRVPGSVARASRLLPWSGWLLGLWTVFAPMLASGLELTINGLGDPRLVNFTLEHQHRWLIGEPLDEDFWSPPIYYPVRNVAAYTAVVAVPGLLFYSPWRALGCDPATAYELWILSMWSLNFCAAYWLLRRGFRFGAAGATVGAYLFGFGAPRTARIGHQQLIPGFLALAVIGVILWLFRDPARRGAGDTRPRIAGWSLLFGVLLLQAYSGFHISFFLAAGLAAAAGWALALGRYRRLLLARLRRDWPIVLALGICGLAALLPLASHHLAAAGDVGVFALSMDNVPRPMSWLAMGPRNLLYGGWYRELPKALQSPPHQNGVGPLTFALALLGLWWARRRRGVSLIVLAVATLFVVSVRLPGDLSLWPLVHAYVPGAAAIRAVGRIGMVLLVPVAIGLAAFVDRLSEVAGRQRGLRALAVGALAVGLCIVCYAEQLNRVGFISKTRVQDHVERLAARVGPRCDAFLLVERGAPGYQYVHDDAAWVALAARVPTINGRYGNSPPGWQLAHVAWDSPAQRRSVRRALRRWKRRHDLDRARICIVRDPGLASPPVQISPASWLQRLLGD